MIANNVYGCGSSGSIINGIYPINEYAMPCGDVVVPEGVTKMGSSKSEDSCFYYNTYVNTIHFPSTLNSMVSRAVYSCVNLTHVYNFENTSVSSISNQAFGNCEKLIDITLPETVVKIDGSFAGCKALNSIVLPANVTSVENSTFLNCISLKNIVFKSADKLTMLGASAFAGCSALETINLPATIKVLNTSVFENCTSLKNFVVHSGMTTISNKAFRGCTSLKTLTLPSSLTTVYATNGVNMSFYDCSALETVNLADDFNCSISFSSSPALTNAAEMLTKLKDNTGSTAKIITFAKAVYDALTEEEIAVATNKNWTVASYGT